MSEARVTFLDMENFALNEAIRIGQVQNALVACGLRTYADPNAIRNKEICEAILRLLDTCRADPIIMSQLKAAARVPA
jgi:hypothetical protein